MVVSSTENRVVNIRGIEESKSTIPALDTPGFYGIGFDEKNPRDWVSSAPSCLHLEGGEQVPGSSSIFVSVRWKSIKIDEFLYQRIEVVEQIHETKQWKTCDKALQPVLDIWNQDFTILKPREFNSSDSLIRSSFEIPSSVAGNLYAVADILLSRIIYGGLQMLAWGSSAFNKENEEILWIQACCTVALGGLLIFFEIWLVGKVIHRDLRVFGIKLSTILLFFAFPLCVAVRILYALSRAYRRSRLLVILPIWIPRCILHQI